MATFVAILTSPATYVILHNRFEWAVGVVVARRVRRDRDLPRRIDVIAHRMVPFPSLYGAEDKLREEDVGSRRRHWYWKTKFRRFIYLAIFFAIVLIIAMWGSRFVVVVGGLGQLVSWAGAAAPMFGYYGMLMFALFFINLIILFGPLFFFSIQQIKGYEPGDADWGVKLADVRGQAEAKEEIRRVVSLWQSGEEFEKAGGKRERGVLFLGPPGTGKTMLSKAIATSFNCPFVTIPGSGFPQMFIGMDALIVRYMARKARSSPPSGAASASCSSTRSTPSACAARRSARLHAARDAHDPRPLFFGEWGALTWDGDLLFETAAWRDHLFAMRAEPQARLLPPPWPRLPSRSAASSSPAAWAAAGQALNQLLVVMDGIDEPPLRKKCLTKKFNTFLDALYVDPAARLRQEDPPQAAEAAQGADLLHRRLQRAARGLDPALTRPGRMGRHIYFRTPTWEDRRDVFDLYITKVAHEEALDTPKARDELARITSGYSPAMIDQVCSLALTYAHSDGRPVFSRKDILEAMTTVEAGVAIGQPYPSTRARDRHPRGRPRRLRASLHGERDVDAAVDPRRGRSGGHHQMAEIEDRFGALALGGGRRPHLERSARMAAEHIFYGQNTTGVGGDLGVGHDHAAHMVGLAGMAPGADRPLGPDRGPREAREGREARHGALREDRLPAHAPLRRIRRRRTPRRWGPGEAPAGRRPARPGVRDRLEHDPRQQGGHRARWPTG